VGSREFEKGPLRLYVEWNTPPRISCGMLVHVAKREVWHLRLHTRLQQWRGRIPKLVVELRQVLHRHPW
jgi:hypothetical protein